MTDDFWKGLCLAWALGLAAWVALGVVVVAVL